ncbi:MAG: Crp/Fnr family transcriptional regulator [Salinivirgaceae bacterium]|nr:Crp/Fnr family transcriptional regulator [Salinivirgaceae bacterium]MDD4746518.1 Crp/Fnr family transcriptional regulator [Salinivirgaceae bacterium]MDY0279419.1 Crp/Fnr family transcriptional regulator [Salinivirgaceae bacterium]
MGVFNNICPKLKEVIFRNSTTLTYYKGEDLCKQAAYAPQVLYLNKGLAKLYLQHRGRNLILRLIGENDFVGLPITTSDNSYYPYSVTALEECGITAIDALNFKEALNMDNNFAQSIIDLQNKYTRIYFKHFLSITQKQLHGRVADTILHLACDVHKQQKFQLLLTRKDLAEFSGMSTESVIRILREFHNDRIINIDGKEIEIISYELLKKLSEIG